MKVTKLMTKSLSIIRSQIIYLREQSKNDEVLHRKICELENAAIDVDDTMLRIIETGETAASNLREERLEQQATNEPVPTHEESIAAIAAELNKIDPECPVTAEELEQDCGSPYSRSDCSVVHNGSRYIFLNCATWRVDRNLDEIVATEVDGNMTPDDLE